MWSKLQMTSSLACFIATVVSTLILLPSSDVSDLLRVAASSWLTAAVTGLGVVPLLAIGSISDRAVAMCNGMC